MNNNIRVKDKREFEDILFNGKKIKNNYYIIYYKERKNDSSRYGIKCCFQNSCVVTCSLSTL